jgi:2,5-diketo-D-gluconate reductase B
MDSLPPIGLGTWQNTEPDECADSVRTALETGYRHIDTAHYYHNEEAVGRGLAAATVPRDDVVVATKVHADKFGLAYDEVIEGAEASLERLGVDYLDLLYVHWPVGNYDPADTLEAFDHLVDRDVIRGVGMSNFSVELLEEAMEHLETSLFAHQVETHPLLPQEELISHAQSNDYYHVAYSPLARGQVFELPVITDIAARHDVSPAQVSLAWLLSKENVRVVPKASTEAHIKDNYEALTLDLSPEEIRAIDTIDERERLIEREGAPWLDD